jgi:Domain of unknown function (DUF2019)
MKAANLKAMSVDELVARFAAIGVEQDDAMMRGAYGDNARYRRLFQQMSAVEQELKIRPRDQRRALVALYNHPNMQVRLMAAKLTLAVDPGAARKILEAIANSRLQPQAGDAGMSLWNLDRGVFVPK